MELLALQEAQCQEQESPEETARQAAAVLPSAEVLQKIIRYDSMLNRQLHRAMKELRTLQKERREMGEGQSPKSDQPKSERNPKAEGRERVILPNEPNALGAPVQSSEFKVQSSQKLPNEPIPASHPSQTSHSSAPTTAELPNEANLRNEPTNETGNEEPLMKQC